MAARRRTTTRSKPADQHEAEELALYIENDGQLYRQQHEPIIRNLQRKQTSGKYNRTLAVKAFEHLAKTGATKYKKEFPGGADMFSPATRRVVATHLRDRFEAEYGRGR